MCVCVCACVRVCVCVHAYRHLVSICWHSKYQAFTRCQETWLGLAPILPLTHNMTLNKSFCLFELIYLIYEMMVPPAL